MLKREEIKALIRDDEKEDLDEKKMSSNVASLMRYGRRREISPKLRMDLADRKSRDGIGFIITITIEVFIILFLMLAIWYIVLMHDIAMPLLNPTGESASVIGIEKLNGNNTRKKNTIRTIGITNSSESLYGIDALPNSDDYYYGDGDGDDYYYGGTSDEYDDDYWADWESDLDEYSADDEDWEDEDLEDEDLEDENWEDENWEDEDLEDDEDWSDF